MDWRSKATGSLVILISVLVAFPLVLFGGEGAGGAQERMSAKVLSAPQRTILFAGPLQSGLTVPHWDKGYLLFTKLESAAAGSPNVWLYNGDGNVVREAAIWVPGSVRVVVSNAAVTSDGRIVVTGFAQREDSVQAFFIALTDASGNITKTIQTNPFVPMQLCVAPDGTVWTAGGVRSDSEEARGAAEVLRRFDFDRGVIEAYLPQSALGSRQPAGNAGRRREVYFSCDAERVVLYSGVANQFVELTTADHKIRQWKLDRSLHDLPLNGFALTSSGEVYSSFYDFGESSVTTGLYNLQRDVSAGIVRWVPVGGSVAKGVAKEEFGAVCGADGKFLVHRPRFNTLNWSEIPR